jgi:uroporphyrinogen decarboxylase
MNSRERVLAAIEHREPDRVPLDECFRLDLWKNLRSFYGVVDNIHVMNKLGIDIYNTCMFPPSQFMKKAITLSMMPWNPVVPLGQGLYRDEWNVVYKLGATGDFVHVVGRPLDDSDAFNSYEFPDLDADGRFDRAEKDVKNNKGFAIAAFMQMTFFEFAAQFLRGFEKFIHDMYTNPTFANNLLDTILKFRMAQAKRFVEMGVDIVRLGDDIGMQTGMMIGPKVWREFLKGRVEQVARISKKNGVAVLYHSDGDIREVIPDLIEIGVDILDPIQPDCMNPAEIKEHYGDKLTLHGGISVQETLPFGSEETVGQEAARRIKDCGFGGGYILAPSNRITPDVPLRNVVALYETAKNLGKYPLKL